MRRAYEKMNSQIMTLQRASLYLLAFVLLLSLVLPVLPAQAMDAGSTRTFLWSLSNNNTTLVSSLTDGNRTLLARPRMNLAKEYMATINFSYGSENEPPLPAKAIEIRIPLHIFFGRDGQPVDSLVTKVLPAPAPPDSTVGSGFEYSIDRSDSDPKNHKVVITNYKPVDPAGGILMEFGWRVLPSLVPDGIADGSTLDGYEYSFQADYKVTRPDPSNPAAPPTVFEESSEPIKIRHDTTASFSDLSKGGRMLETWPEVLGPAPADAADYFYVEWSVGFKMSQYNTQPFYLYVEDTTVLPANPDHYEFIGYKEISRVLSTGQTTGKYVLSTYEEYQARQPELHFPTPDTSGRSFAGTYYFRYPRTILEQHPD